MEYKPREPERIERVLGKLALIWKKYPDLRLLQLIEDLKLGLFDNPYYLEDKELELRLDNYIKEHGI